MWEENSSSHPHISFILPANLPFFPLKKYFGTHFSNFFCLEKKLRNVFSKFELEKLRKTRSEVFIQGKK
jgi:hypothetical protein